MISQRVDRRQTEAFGDRMRMILSAGALVTITSIGHRMGLFDTLGELEPSTIRRRAEVTRKWRGPTDLTNPE